MLGFRLAMAGGDAGMWRQVGLLSGMVCVGSVAGAVAWGAFMQNHALYYETNAPGLAPHQYHSLYASAIRFSVVFQILYGFEFLCLIICKLMLLGRLATSAAQSSQENVSGMSRVRRRWVNGRVLPIVYRAMVAVVILGAVVGMVAMAVTGAYKAQGAGLYDQAAAACDAAGNDTNSSLAFISAADEVLFTSTTVESVQASTEALTLLLVSLAFLVIVSWSVALFRIVQKIGERSLLDRTDLRDLRLGEVNAERILVDTMQAAAQQRRRLTAACVIVLITFPARAAFDLLYAYALFNDPKNPACGRCGPCQSDSFLIRIWLNYTPEFQASVVAASSPLPLSLSLWLMTKARAQARLITADVDRSRGDDV